MYFIESDYFDNSYVYVYVDLNVGVIIRNYQSDDEIEEEDLDEFELDKLKDLALDNFWNPIIKDVEDTGLVEETELDKFEGPVFYCKKENGEELLRFLRNYFLNVKKFSNEESDDIRFWYASYTGRVIDRYSWYEQEEEEHEGYAEVTVRVSIDTLNEIKLEL